MMEYSDEMLDRRGHRDEDGEEQKLEEVIGGDKDDGLTDEERKSKEAEEGYDGFKKWLLESEYQLLRKVKYMVINGMEVTNSRMNDMRQKATIPLHFRKINLTNDQHLELEMLQA